MPLENTPSNSSPRSKVGAGCLRIFFIPFFLAGCFMFYQITWKPLSGISRARSWTPVECTILKSELAMSRGSKGSTTHRVSVRYAYDFNGQRYEADRYGFSDTASNTGRAKKQAAVNALPAGASATCYVNPANPSEAVIEREATGELWWGLFSLPFLAIGALGFLFAPRMAAQGSNSRSGPVSSTASRWNPVQPSSPTGVEGPVVLKPATSPAAKLVGMILFALIWNGIVSIFVWEVIKGFQRGRPEWFLTIFISIFVLVGLGALGGVIYQLLNLFNPRIELTVNKGAVPLGSRLDVSWSFAGRTTRLRNLRIVLEGVERATYRRGTNSATDENVFAKLPILETDEQGSIQTGSATLTVPAELMHSFQARNNAIVWRFKVNGEIARFPDVSDVFPMTILPRNHAQSL